MTLPSPTASEVAARAARRLRVRLVRERARRRGVALILVLGALTVMTVLLTEFQDEASSSLNATLVDRDQLKAEFAAKSAINLSRLLIAAEPTIRKALAPLFLLSGGAPPQIPVWEFAGAVLGAFNDETGTAAFTALAGVNVAEGKGLGMSGAGFEVSVVDEDSKINVNAAARGDAISRGRLGAALLGLMAGEQYDPLFEERDRDNQFSDRTAICGAIVDWADPDQEGYACDPHSGQAAAAIPEDSFYQLLDPPYPRKNAAYDSLEELRMVRGMGDDFWATFVDPDPEDPKKRVLTVWGQGAINVNTANGQTILALVCGYAQPAQPLCTDPLEAMKFLSAMNVVRTFTMGAPIFRSPKGFVNALKGRGMFGSVLAALELKPVALLSDSELMKAVSTESKLFSIFATGIVKTGTRETRTRIHAVVDFRNAPAPGQNPLFTQALDSALGGALSAAQASLPEGATDQALAGALKPSAGGSIVYYRYQ